MSARSIRRSHEREAERRDRRIAKRAVLATSAVAATAAIAAPGAQAANFNVTNLNNAGANSLRAAITSANGAVGADTISFSGGATSGEITVLTEIPITDDLTINGPGRQLSVSGDANVNNVRDFATSNVAQGDTRIFNITDPTSPGAPTQNVTISGLTLREGVSDLYNSGMGGFLSEGGGAVLATESNLTLNDVAMSDNAATSVGGAVYLNADGPSTTAGVLTVTNSTFTNNRAKSGGGAIASLGEKYAPGSGQFGTTITNTEITGNRAGGTNFGGFGSTAEPDGGGVYTKYGQALVSGSTVTGNTAQTGVGPTAQGSGGGVSIGGGEVRGSVVSGNTAGSKGGGATLQSAKLVNSTVSGNTVVDGFAGGVIQGPKYVTGPGRIQNSTISGNTVGGSAPYGGRAGGVVTYSYLGDTAVIRNSTIAANTAATTGGGVLAVRFSDEEPGVDLQSTIVADNTAGGTPSDTLGIYAGGMGNDPDPNAFTAGFSLVEAPLDSVFLGSPSGSNIIGVDPQLGPLAANGGLTQTHAPALTSPAIDSGQANGLTSDQRGSTRPIDSVATNAPLSDGTDIGAFEVQETSAVGGDPTTKFDKKPPKKVKLKGKAGKVTLTFSGTGNAGSPVTFECKVDKIDFVPCASPLKLKLAKGKHKIEVRAVDAAGRVDSTPEKAKIKVAKKKPKKKK